MGWGNFPAAALFTWDLIGNLFICVRVKNICEYFFITLSHVTIFNNINYVLEFCMTGGLVLDFFKNGAF